MYKFSILIGVMAILSFVAGCGGGPSCPDFGNSEPIFSYQISVKIFGVTFEKKIEIDFDGDRKPTQDLLKPYEKEWEEKWQNYQEFSTSSTTIPTSPSCTPVPNYPEPTDPIPTRTPYHLEFLTEGMVDDAKNVGIVELVGIECPKIFINGWIPIHLRNHLVNNGFIITDENDCDFILCDLNLNKITKEDFENNEVVLITTKSGRGIVSGTMKLENMYSDDDMSFYKDKSLYTPIKIVGMYYKK